MPGDSLLFVYGTLRHEIAAAEHRTLLGSARWLGPASVAGVLIDLGNYPGLLILAECEASGGTVSGELYELTVPERILAALDDYEGVSAAPQEYRRVCVNVRQEGQSRTLAAWAYEFVGEYQGFPVIEGGDYVSYLRRAKRVRPLPARN